MNACVGVLWQRVDQGARVLRVLGDTPCPAVPSAVAGIPVTEIGPYCFAQADRLPPDARFWADGGRGADAFSHAIAGEFVQGVILPAGVRALHNAAFYNCRRLEWIVCPPALESLGSDLFTNCRALDRFVLDAAPDAPTALKKLAAAVSADVEAVFAPGGQTAARVFFPEYFEFLDENTPAHIFNHSIEGEGYRYRQCFDGSVLNFAEYDSAFAQACVGESARTLCRIALGRLSAPFALRPAARSAYADCLKAHPRQAAAPAIAQRDLSALRLLFALFDADARREAALACADSGWSQGAALALSAPAPRRPRSYDFDDL